jgi:CheY-like chemotaxis protein
MDYRYELRKGEKLSVLVVDDESDIRDTLITFLEMMELFTLIVQSPDGSDASLKLKNMSFDFVITDLMMPKVKGIELVERVKREDKINKKEFPTPIMILSANVTSQDVQKALHFGVKYVLTKPCTAEQFMNKVGDVIRKDLRHKVKVLKNEDEES